MCLSPFGGGTNLSSGNGTGTDQIDVATTYHENTSDRSQSHFLRALSEMQVSLVGACLISGCSTAVRISLCQFRTGTTPDWSSPIISVMSET